MHYCKLDRKNTGNMQIMWTGQNHVYGTSCKKTLRSVTKSHVRQVFTATLSDPNG